MKYGLAIIIFILGCASGTCENINVYSFSRKEYQIPKNCILEKIDTKKDEITLKVLEIGEKKDEIKLEGIGIKKIYENAVKYDSSDDPFFGKGIYVVLESKGDFFIVFFEKDKRSKFTNGKRFAIGQLMQLGSETGLFVGDPYEGSSSFDPEILLYLNEKFTFPDK
jgi:hypothetical protein